MQRRIEEYKENERKNSGKMLGKIDHSIFLFVDDKSGSHNISAPIWGDELSDYRGHNFFSPRLRPLLFGFLNFTLLYVSTCIAIF